MNSPLMERYLAVQRGSWVEGQRQMLGYQDSEMKRE